MKIGSLALREGVPALMGIVNVTPDSFSDGGLFLHPRRAVEHALGLAEEGADLIDIGGESTRPGADPVPLDEELNRVLPVIEGIRRQSSVALSIDTMKAPVARAAIAAGADLINDVSAGRFDPLMLPCAAEHGVPICLMHMRGDPRTMQEAPAYGDVMGEIRAFLADAIRRATLAGVRPDKILIDPGIGFGKTVEHNLTILRELPQLTDLGAPIVIGTSRKAFIGKILDESLENRLEGTLATLAVAIEGRAAILRVHDVLPAKRFVKMYAACRNLGI